MLFSAWVGSDLLSVPRKAEFWLSFNDPHGTRDREQDQVRDRRVAQGWNRTAESGALPGVFTTPTAVPCPLLRPTKALSRCCCTWGSLKYGSILLLQRWPPAGWEHPQDILKTPPGGKWQKTPSVNSSEIMGLPHGIMMLTTVPLKSQHLNFRLYGSLSQHCTQWNLKLPTIQEHFNIRFYKFKTTGLWKKTQTFCRKHNNLLL